MVSQLAKSVLNEGRNEREAQAKGENQVFEQP